MFLTSLSPFAELWPLFDFLGLDELLREILEFDDMYPDCFSVCFCFF